MRVALLLLLLSPIPPIRLSPQTLKEFQAYMEVADRAMIERGRAGARVALPSNGAPQITPWNGDGPRALTGGLVHDWVAAAFIPGASAAGVAAVLQDYEKYPEIYSPDLLSARVLGSSGNKRQVTFRTLKKKVITVVLDIDYDIEYRELQNGRIQVWSRSSAIREVDHAGSANETRSAPDVGAGFLWRLNSYWQLEDRDGGAYMECRAVSLTRDVPPGIGWIIKPMITALPRESLHNLMVATRAAVEERLKRQASVASSAVGLVE